MRNEKKETKNRQKGSRKKEQKKQKKKIPTEPSHSVLVDEESLRVAPLLALVCRHGNWRGGHPQKVIGHKLPRMFRDWPRVWSVEIVISDSSLSLVGVVLDRRLGCGDYKGGGRAERCELAASCLTPPSTQSIPSVLQPTLTNAQTGLVRHHKRRTGHDKDRDHDNHREDADRGVIDRHGKVPTLHAGMHAEPARDNEPDDARQRAEDLFCALLRAEERLEKLFVSDMTKVREKECKRCDRQAYTDKRMKGGHKWSQESRFARGAGTKVERAAAILPYSAIIIIYPPPNSHAHRKQKRCGGPSQA